MSTTTERDVADAERAATLEQRLHDGYARIDAALASAQDVERWEDFWERLLREYEAVCDRLGDPSRMREGGK